MAETLPDGAIQGYFSTCPECKETIAVNMQGTPIDHKCKKTSSEWNIKHDFQIMDPDGWNRRNFQYSFYEELITEEEFLKRVMHSTCLTFNGKK